MHEVMLAMQESSLSLQALIEVRNKAVEAYQEISKLQLQGGAQLRGKYNAEN